MGAPRGDGWRIGNGLKRRIVSLARRERESEGEGGFD